MINVNDDSVYTAMCKRFGRAADQNLYQDPYHRYLRILEYLNSNSLITEGASCLDLGCLRPELASLLINNYNADVTGVDQWDMDMEWSQIKMRFINANLAEDFPSLLSRQYDVVFALEVLEHMIDTDLFLSRIRQCVRKGGVVVISTPNINNLRNRVVVPLGGYPVPMEFKNVIHHVRLYNVLALRSHLEEHGFAVLDIRGVNFFPYRGPMRNVLYRYASEALATMIPSLCSNIFAVAALR